MKQAIRFRKTYTIRSTIGECHWSSTTNHRVVFVVAEWWVGAVKSALDVEVRSARLIHVRKEHHVAFAAFLRRE